MWSDIKDLHIRHFKVRTIMKIESWQTLVHVCRRWRGLVFGSPRRLNLKLFCNTRSRSARRTLDIWPPLPLLIHGDVTVGSVKNIVAVLGHSDRISQINLKLYTNWETGIEKFWTAMQVPFPELAGLHLSTGGVYAPVGLDSFLDGSAPRLRPFYLHGISFPGLPKLLSSATHLVGLYLHAIPDHGYISPEVMATCLSMLTSLRPLQLDFESHQPFPDQEYRRSPPPTRTILPALTSFSFGGDRGVIEYLEDFVFWIDTPPTLPVVNLDHVLQSR